MTPILGWIRIIIWLQILESPIENVVVCGGFRYVQNSFDAIVTANMLHLLDDPGDTLIHLSGFLKPGGMLLSPLGVTVKPWQVAMFPVSPPWRDSR